MISHWFFATSVSHASCPLSYASSAFHPLVSISQPQPPILGKTNNQKSPNLGRFLKGYPKGFDGNHCDDGRMITRHNKCLRAIAFYFTCIFKTVGKIINRIFLQVFVFFFGGFTVISPSLSIITCPPTSLIFCIA